MTAALFVLAALAAAAPEPVAIRDATVFVRPGEVIEHGTVLVRNGTIAAVGTDVQIPPGTRLLEGTGLVVCAGFVDFDTSAGLGDPPGEKASRAAGDDPPDLREEANPYMREANRRGVWPGRRASEEWSLADEGQRKFREAGFTALVAAPEEGILAGISAAFALSNRTRRSAMLAPDVAMVASFRPPKGEDRYPKTGLGAIALLRQTLYDAGWYGRRRAVWEADPRGERPPYDPALEALAPVLDGRLPLAFRASEANDIRRALDIAHEFHARLILLGGHHAYRFADRLDGVAVVYSLRLPDEIEYDPADPDERPDKQLRDEIRRREEVLACPAVLRRAGVDVAFSTRGLDSPKEALDALATLCRHGLSEDDALAALTTTPARLAGTERTLGTMEIGKAAHLVVLTDRPGRRGVRVRFAIVDGAVFEFEAKAEQKEEAPPPLVGAWTCSGALEGVIRIRGTKAFLWRDGEKTEAADVKREGDRISFRIGETAYAATIEGDTWSGEGWSARRGEPRDEWVETDADRIPPVRTGGNVLIRAATVHTMTQAEPLVADVLVRDGRIAEVGRGLRAPEGVVVIEADGMHLTPGVVDCHSHIAADWINEGSDAIVAECRMRDSLDPDDVHLYRGLSGGVTAANLLHGSANPIGGQNAILRFRYGGDILFEDAPPGIKFALGENVKRSNYAPGTRFPNTRPGVEAVYRRAFEAAREYRAAWERHRAGEGPEPRRDLRLEALLEILEGRRQVHCHSYRSDEILMMMRVAEEFGWRVRTFQHILEGYQIGPELAAHGAGASTFADWWSYKIEAFDAIPHNAALMMRAGVRVSINSDDPEMQRRLPMEAAKCMKYGGLSAFEALALVTTNPARQLGLDGRIGTIEPGKDADLALWNGRPLSAFSRCVLAMIRGEIYHDRREGPSAADPTWRPAEERRPPLAIPPARAYVLRNAVVHPVTSAPFEGAVVFADGRITALGRDVAAPEGAVEIDLAGLHVYPGFIDANTWIGLTEIESVRGTVDTEELGTFQPDLRAASAVHSDSAHIEVTRFNGITTVAVAPPSGPRVRGQSAVVRLAGWTTPEMIRRAEWALHVTWPEMPRPSEKEEERRKKEEAVRQLKEYFARARRYAERMDAGAEEPRDPQMEAMRPYVRGQRPVVVHASGRREIRAAVEWAVQEHVRLVIAEGSEAWMVADLVARHDVPVIYGPVWRSDWSDAGRYFPNDIPYSVPERLRRAGVRFCISTRDAENVRNLPYHAATAAAWGLPREEALKAVTIYPAQILGLDGEIGSLEVGKRADVIVTTGDPLEVVCDVVAVFVDGHPQPMESKHTRLYDRWRARQDRR